MANAKVLAAKQQVVANLTEKVKGAASLVLVDYKGITVAEDTTLRAEMRKNNIEYAVVKNTLLRFAMNANGYEELVPLLDGTTSMAISPDDSIAPARVVEQFASKLNNKFNIKGGFIEGRVLSIDELKSIASLSSKDALIAQVLGTMLAPITALAFVLKQAADKSGAVVESAPAEVVAEAPAEAPAAEAAEEVAETVEAKEEAAETVAEEAPAEETAE